MIKKNKFGLVYFSIFLVLLTVVFRSLILNLGKNLLDWLDHPYIVWVIYQNIGHLKSFDFRNLFNSNAFYPYSGTMLFSDLLLPQSIIALPFSFFIKNQILVFNITFFINFILNYISLYIFWKYIFKKKFLAFLGSLFFIFSPYFFGEIGHFQMMCFWPFFLSLYFLLKNNDMFKWKNIFYSGLFLSLQFLASVYLAVFLIVTIFCYVFVNLLCTKKIKLSIKTIFGIFLVFVLIDGMFIKSYVDVKKQYNVSRSINEYIQYSSHLSDYVFSGGINSILHQSNLIKKWNSFDKHGGRSTHFIGFLFSVLMILGVLSVVKKNKKIIVGVEINKESIFYLLLVILGFLFSLGPRLNFNGVYAHIPLPYLIILKYVPFFDSIRALSRWNFILILGILYFCLKFINNFLNKNLKFNKKILFFVVLILWYFIEYFPINVNSLSKNYINDDYSYLINNCKNKVLLEIPYTHLFGVKGNIVDGLGYITKTELSSITHGCSIVNGYSGYDLPENIESFQKLNNFVNTSKYDEYLEELNTRDVTYIKFNKEYMNEDEVETYQKMFDKLTKEKLLIKVSEKVYKISLN
jgi:hypothetical protein